MDGRLARRIDGFGGKREGHAVTRPRDALVFSVDEHRFACPVAFVERVALAAEISPTPNAPPVVAGTVNYRGTWLPVVSLRRRLGRPERAVRTTDRFVIVLHGGRGVALLADAVDDVNPVAAEQFVEPADLLPGLWRLHGVTRPDEELLFIHDMALFLGQEISMAFERPEALAHDPTTPTT